MITGIFITGTDTGVGKTVVATGIVRLLARQGRRVVGLKPVATGAERTPAGLRNEDALALAAASSIPLTYELTNPYCFEPAVAPHIAAAELGVAIRPGELRRWYEQATDGADIAVVEGAGGWRVPLHPSGFLSDMAEDLGLGVVLVVGLRLGCLSHARLSFEAIERSRRCPFLGWIGNRIDPDLERQEENLAALEQLLGGPALAVLPRLDDPSAEAAGRCLEASALPRLPVLRRVVTTPLRG
jgi:dethiobiotin synthetase